MCGTSSRATAAVKRGAPLPSESSKPLLGLALPLPATNTTIRVVPHALNVVLTVPTDAVELVSVRSTGAVSLSPSYTVTLSPGSSAKLFTTAVANSGLDAVLVAEKRHVHVTEGV
jgi:hypothetical protein